MSEEVAEIIIDFFNAIEAAAVNAKRQIAELKGAAGKTEKAEPAAVSETTFNILKFEPQIGAKIGEYEVAYRASNLPDKFSYAYNVLRTSNATIKDRYHGQGYEFSYWLYGEDRIYRQKLKPKTWEKHAKAGLWIGKDKRLPLTKKPRLYGEANLGNL